MTTYSNHQEIQALISRHHKLRDCADVSELCCFGKECLGFVKSESNVSLEAERIGFQALKILAITLRSMGFSLKTQNKNNIYLYKKLQKLTNKISIQDAKDAFQIVSEFSLLVDDPLNERKHNEVALYQFGYDGHMLTREAAKRLGLCRFYEKTSTQFSTLLHRLYLYVVKNGRGYLAWSAHYPLFFCDLRLINHRRCACLMSQMSGGELVVITPEYPQDTRKLFADRAIVVEDTLELLSQFTGHFASAVLLERRLGGWTLTFPLTTADPNALTDKSLDPCMRALARCRDLVCNSQPL